MPVPPRPAIFPLQLGTRGSNGKKRDQQNGSGSIIAPPQGTLLLPFAPPLSSPRSPVRGKRYAIPLSKVGSCCLRLDMGSDWLDEGGRVACLSLAALPFFSASYHLPGWFCGSLVLGCIWSGTYNREEKNVWRESARRNGGAEARLNLCSGLLPCVRVVCGWRVECIFAPWSCKPKTLPVQ